MAVVWAAEGGIEAPGEDTGRVGVSDLMGVGECEAEDPTDPTDPTEAIEAICGETKKI